jgi:16S rRNA (guanine1207-N2)-methyltransferase
VKELSHYFTNETPKKVNEYDVKFVFENHSFTLKSTSGVFSSTRLDPGSHVLIHTLLQEQLSGHLLDLGCGYGPIGITLAKLRPQLTVTMSDVKEAAIALTEINVKLNRLVSVHIHQSDGFENIDETFDVIVLNPPIRAGKKVMYQLYEQSYHHLKENGSFYMVIRKDLGALSSEKELRKQYKTVERLARQSGYHVYRAMK